MITSLEKQIDIPERKLSIKYFSGQTGIKIAADIVLEEGHTKKATSWETTDANIKKHSFEQVQDYVNRKFGKNFFGEIIVSSDPDNKLLKDILSRDKKEFRKSIIVNPKKYPFKSAMMVFDDMLLIFAGGYNINQKQRNRYHYTKYSCDVLR